MDPSSSLQRHVSAGVLFFTLLAAICCSTPPALAQLGFTEFALTDTALNSRPGADFWIASAAPADVDGDGDLDMLIAGYYVIYPTEENPDGWVDDRLTLYRNDGPSGAAGWALTPVPIEDDNLSFTGADLAWGDYDKDGDPDVIVGATGRMVLYRNDGGTLVPTTTSLPEYWEDSDFTTMDQRSLTWADFDNDGDLDLLVPSILAQWTYVPTALLRNDGAGTDGAWTFTDVTAGLPITINGVSAWADMEGDGDLDLLLANVSAYEDDSFDLFRNDAGTLVRADSGLARIRYGTTDWGDADNDGDLDIVVAGNLTLPDGFGETVVRILFNDGAGGYTPLIVAHDFPGPEPWLDFKAVTWADYDSDGDMDLLVSGEWLGNDIFGQSVVYVNTGGSFALASDPLPAPVAGNAGGAFTWFDVDGDGDLDYFVAGGYYVADGNGLIEARTQLFRNDALASNAAPTAPAGLAAAVSGSDVTLGWSPAVDDGTPTAALTYDLEVLASGADANAEKVLPQPGNVSKNTSWTLRALEPGTYQWSVRAVDNAFNGSPIARGRFRIGAPTSTDPPAPRVVALSPAHPNPTSDVAGFTLALDRARRVTLAVHDVMGRRVALLHDGALEAGVHPFTLDGGKLRSGTYLLRASYGDRVIVRRVTLLR